MKYIGMSQMHVHSNYTTIIEQPTQDVSCLIDCFCYVFAHQDRLANYHNVAMSLYDILCQAYAL